MLLGVLDVGSNTIHLQVMQAHPGARPTPTTNLKTELRLTDYLDEIGNISPLGIEELHKAISEAMTHAKEFKTEEMRKENAMRFTPQSPSIRMTKSQLVFLTTEKSAIRQKMANSAAAMR